MGMTELCVRTFECGTEKEAALKPLEEAAEVFGAFQVYETTHESNNEVMDRWLLSDLADELADCITACCNLAARYDLDLQAAIGRVEERNRKRGRYEEERGD